MDLVLARGTVSYFYKLKTFVGCGTFKLQKSNGAKKINLDQCNERVARNCPRK